MKKHFIKILTALLVISVTFFVVEPFIHSIQHSDVAIAKDDKDKGKDDKDDKEKKGGR